MVRKGEKLVGFEGLDNLGNLGNLSSSFLIPEEEDLVKRGYSLVQRTGFFGSPVTQRVGFLDTPVMIQYAKVTDTYDATSLLDKEVLDKAYSYISRLSSKGGYETLCSFRANLFLSGNALSSALYTYSYSLVSLVGSDHLPAWFFVGVSGVMSGPHPEGVPQDYILRSGIYFPVSHKTPRSDSTFRVSRRGISHKVEGATPVLLSLLDTFKDIPEFVLGSEVYLVSGSPLPRKKVDGSGEENNKTPSPSYLYIGTVGDLLSGPIWDQGGEEYQEEGDQ